MVLKLDFVDDGDFSDLIAAEWEGFENPLQRIFRLYCPVVDNDRAKSLAANTQRELEGHQKARSNPDVESIWFKVVDTDAGNKIVGGAAWVFLKKYPRTNKGPSAVERHPEGGSRIFAKLAFEQIETLEEHKGTRPHATLGSFFTIPAYRRRGIGNMLMKAGIERIDELGMESFIEASSSGMLVYEKNGYIKVQHLDINPNRPEGLSDKEIAEWENTASAILPAGVTLMHRPAVDRRQVGGVDK